MLLGPEPSHAERARTLVAGRSAGVLSTVAADSDGCPFGSLAPFGLDDVGRPVLCVSDLAEHTRNLQRDRRASLLVSEPSSDGADPLAVGRVTLVGEAVLVPAGEVRAARAAHLAGNPHARYYVDFGDFSLWRLTVDAVRYVGGYGRMSWVEANAYAAAAPDPLAPMAADVLEHLNNDHADACLLVTRHLAGQCDVTEACATAVDRYGVDLAARTPAGQVRVRLGFPVEATDAESVRVAVVALVRQARIARNERPGG